MRKLAALLLLLFLAPTPSFAATTITLTEGSHQQFDGKFFDDSLATSLMPSGRLGKMIFEIPAGYRIWKVDGQLIEEVQAMASGYKLVNGKDGLGSEIAKQWLARFSAISKYDQVSALPYGNPSGYWINRFIPSQKDLFLKSGADVLSKYYGHSISAPSNFENYQYFQLTPYQSQTFADAQKALSSSGKYLLPAEIQAFQLRAGAIFNQDLSTHWRNLLAKDLSANTDLLLQKIRLAPGRFTISAHKQDLPITVINDFSNPASLILNISEMNGRIQAVNRISVKLEGKSRVQVKIPVEVLTSGDSAIDVGITDEKGKTLGLDVLYPITSRVISPIATWITYIAAIILFVSALFRSLRRIRKRSR